MAYMSQEKKKALAPAIKRVLKKYHMNGSIAVRNHSTLVVNLKSGELDIIKNHNDVVVASRGQNPNLATNYIQVNQYYTNRDYSGKVAKFFSELINAMNNGNHDNSDSQTDYFDVGWYIDINVGQWNQAYVYEVKR